ncbi:hypothetical protein [Bacillus marinisedimentorum]|uniref:hypothetical protein n=1 Tax=Bacillus marinisedimentorum TaxID=1821260 RepID=UPI00087241D3|nr:hypothetical protein [Bacillus marinisedimentorum]
MSIREEDIEKVLQEYDVNMAVSDFPITEEIQELVRKRLTGIISDEELHALTLELFKKKR